MTAPSRDPVITSLSAISSLAMNPEAMVEAIFKKENRFVPPDFDTVVLGDRRIAKVSPIAWREFIPDRKTVRSMSRETRLASCAVKLCLADAGVIVDETFDGRQIAIYAGTGSSGIQFDEIANMLNVSSNETTGRFDIEKFSTKGLQRLNPLLSFKILPNMPPSVAAMNNGIKGSNLVFNPWEGNALQGLLEACFDISAGREKMVLCGGSDCKTHSAAFLTFHEYGLFLNSDVVLSEGSSFVAVEPLGAALHRGATPLCRLGGVASASISTEAPVAYPGSEAIYAELMERCLSENKVRPSDIDLVIDSNDFNHPNDRAENRAIASIFSGTPTLSPKKHTGNAFAASGFFAISVGVSLLRRPANRVHRVLVNSFSVGSELHSILLEKP